MDALNRFAILILLSFLVYPLQAQDDLLLSTSVMGSLEPGESDTWVFSAADGAMLSFQLRSTSGDLDPVMTLNTSSGSPFMRSDDRSYPDARNPLLEGISIPRTDTYSVTVSAFGSSSGSYELLMLPGFADLSHQIQFDDPALWQTGQPDQEVLLGDNRMALVVVGLQEQSLVTYNEAQNQPDQYLRVEIPELAGQSGWRVGLVARQQDAANYYRYALNESGQWQFSVLMDGSERIIRDWSTHPAIVPGQIAFSLGWLLNGTSFEFFYNDQLIGRLYDDTIQAPGRFGLMAAVPPQIGSESTFLFQKMTVTTPSTDPIIPEQIHSGASSVMVQELQRRRLIPSFGQMSLLVPESFVTYNRPGTNELLLGGSEQSFRSFALGTTFTWEISAPNLPAGCGLLLRIQDEDEYVLAYADQTGAYGLSPRRRSSFEPGIFGEGWLLDNGPHRLLVIADDEQLLYYVDGHLAGTLDHQAVQGRVGNAVVNFEAVTTSCQFTDSWVWAWE